MLGAMTMYSLLATCLSLAAHGQAHETSMCSSAHGAGQEGSCAGQLGRNGGLQDESFEFVQVHASKLKARPPPLPPSIAISAKTFADGDWTSVQCDAGWKAIGGGCNADGQPHRFQMDGPDGESGWKCGGRGGRKQVWVRCARGIDVTTQNRSGGDWTDVRCEAGRKVISGGCNAFGPPYKMMYNGPVGNDVWRCGGHGGSKLVWAICALGINVSTVEKKDGDWAVAQCAPGQKLLGGGCNVHEGPAEFMYSGPLDFQVDYNAWKCGGLGGKKSVQASCWEPLTPRPCTSFTSAEACPTARCTVVEAVCKDFDLYMLANNTDLSVAKSYKDSTRDAQSCANICGGESEAFVWSRTSGACWCAELTSDYSGWISSDDTAYYRVGSGIFSKKACRLDKSDTTVNGEGSVKVISGITFQECLSRCKADSRMCTGIEYGHKIKRCELWTKPIGSVYDRTGFECVNLAKPPVCSAPDASQPSDEYPCSCGLAACGDSSVLCHSLQNYCDTPKPTPSPTPKPTNFYKPFYRVRQRTGPFSYKGTEQSADSCESQCDARAAPCFDYFPSKKFCQCLYPTGNCNLSVYAGGQQVIYFKRKD
eukprot:TRINITY_DN1167_c0_g1_i4.p1 TRINITY_DN1167_c0_g1~~TRINITY_DN1167_c0_g1_i4.p1  ORF type:complete len:593 (+),score=33.70 TRINITY_DN1167_c0_g1_i4:178-1956(+)